MSQKCIVIGGGIAGLAAGIAMRTAGYRVTVYEQAETLEPLGAALSIWGNAMAGLDWLGCGDALRARSAQICQVTLQRPNKRILMGPIDVSETDSYLPTRALLQQTLLDHLDPANVRLGTMIDDACEQHGQVILSARGNTIDQADLLIAADGIHSKIARAHIGGTPKFAGYVGGLALCKVADTPLPSGQALELWGDGERFGLFDAGHGWRYWFYMRNAADSSAIADITLPSVQTAATGWPAAVVETVGATSAATFTPVAINAKPPPQSMGQGRIICVGDALHPMEPNQGQGGCQSIEDAWALGVLAQRLPPADILPELERQRLKRVGKYVQESAGIGTVVHGKNPMIRAGVLTAFALIPRAIEQRQFLSRIMPPLYS